MFFIFSLISNLNEEYKFNKIIDLSFLNTLQILVYVPSFIFLISVILFIVLLRSKNEMIIIKSYFDIKKYLIFFLPIVLIFTFLEIEKKSLSQYLEETKIDIFKINNKPRDKIIINNSGIDKTFTVIRNFNLNNTNDTEYRFYSITNNKINIAEYSNELIFKDNMLVIKSYTQYRDKAIKYLNNQKTLESNFIDLILQSSIVNYISKKNNWKFDPNHINLIFFFIFFLCYVFLYFFNSKFVSPKQSLFSPIVTCIIILIYTFLIFNNSITSYKQEYEFLASLVMGMFLLKAFLNE